MADRVVAEIREAGGEAVASYDDVASVEGGERICRTALDAFERVDVLVNNAGILRDKSFANTTEDLWDGVVRVHLKGTYCATHPVYCHMKERGEGGSIINTSSTSGLNGNFGQCNYGAAKAGIFGFSRCLSIEGQKYGIRVNVLAPVALTRLTEDLPGFEDAQRRARLDPKLVSPLVVYLASDLAKGVTGRTFFVGGGRIAEMRMVTHTGVSKSEADGLWTPEEIAAQMTAGAILLPD
jgi:NAD(P)-dependent dehydrogenase (short-subunit alcohol dehydrogenase family)